MSNRRFFAFLLLNLGTWLPLLTCQADPIRIVAAENFYGSLAQLLAGPNVPVVSILSNPNQDPHDFTTNVSTAKAVADASIVIYNGIGYDAWMDHLLSTSSQNHRVVFNVSTLVGAKDGDNPHLWYKPQTMVMLANALTTALATQDPANGEVYQQRSAAFQSTVQQLTQLIEEIRSEYQGTSVTATEPVFGYMAEALGLHMLNYPFQVNIMNDNEPSVEQTADFEKSLRTKTAKVLFYNSQVTDPTTERLQKLAKDSQVVIVGVTETQPQEYSNYVEWMLQELLKVKAALKLASIHSHS